MEEVLIKKDQKYMVSGLSINQKAETDVIILDLNARQSLNDYYKHLKGFGFRWENDLVKY